MRLSKKSEQQLRDHVLRVLEGALPEQVSDESTVFPITQLVGDRIPQEIATRVVENAKLVSPSKLRDQVLIVLADYRNHAWVGGKLSQEKRRIELADMIMGWDNHVRRKSRR